MDFALKSMTMIVVAIALSACGKGSGDSAALPSTSPGGGGGTTPGVIQGDALKISVANNTGLFDPIVFQSGSYGTACEIAASVTLSSGDTNCTIDVLELDNYMHDVDINYNVPQDSCEYFVITPSWHWNFSTGYGPSAVTLEVDSQGNLTDLAGGAADNGCSTVQNGVGVSCAAAAEISTTSGNLPICAYNHSHDNNDDPNCCLGSYTQTKLVDTDDDGTADSTTVVDLDWGGNIANCIGGMVRRGWAETDRDGFPNSVIQYVADSGINDVIKIPANASNVVDSFQYGTNFYETTGNPHSHSGFVSATTSNVPYAFDPIDDLDGTSMRGFGFQVPYTFTCLNRGGEVKHRMNVYVREWNTYFEWLTYISSAGTSGDPDVRGLEGTDCEFESAFGDGCNDYTDFDDLLDNLGNSDGVLDPGEVYDTSTPNATLRNSWHPQVNYQ